MAVIRRLAVCAAVLLVMLALVDICLRGFSYWTRLPFSVVDIQTQETLRAKLMDLKGRQGLKIVAFGDSVVYGASMAGIPGLDWRNATLDRVLEGDLRRDLGRNDVHVMNLGMNGFLYTDMQMLAQLLQQSDVDAYVFNVSLRSFCPTSPIPPIK